MKLRSLSLGYSRRDSVAGNLEAGVLVGFSSVLGWNRGRGYGVSVSWCRPDFFRHCVRSVHM